MFERGTIHDLLGDLVVYRNLEPMDGRLLGLRHIWSEVTNLLPMIEGRSPSEPSPFLMKGQSPTILGEGSLPTT